MTTVRLMVNGVDRAPDTDPGARLVDLLREQAGLTGTPDHCGDGSCGACLVIVDGKPIAACTMPAMLAEGRAVETVEGLAASDGTLSAVQRAFLDHGAVGCGACTSGMLMAATHLLRINPWIAEDEARAAILGNHCRCTGYGAPVAAILAAASELQARGEADRPLVETSEDFALRAVTGRPHAPADLRIEGLLEALVVRRSAADAAPAAGMIACLTGDELPSLTRLAEGAGMEGDGLALLVGRSRAALLACRRTAGPDSAPAAPAAAGHVADPEGLTFMTARHHPLPIEPDCAVAHWQADGELQLYASRFGPDGPEAGELGAQRLQLNALAPPVAGGREGTCLAAVAAEAARHLRAPLRVRISRELELRLTPALPAQAVSVALRLDPADGIEALRIAAVESDSGRSAAATQAAARRLLGQGDDAQTGAPAGEATLAIAGFAAMQALDEAAREREIDPLAALAQCCGIGASHTQVPAMLAAGARQFGWQGRRNGASLDEDGRFRSGVGISLAQHATLAQAAFAEVALDVETGHVTVLRLLVAGPATDAQGLRAMQGGLARGYGFALTEGRQCGADFATPRLTDHRLPFVFELPELEIAAIEPAGAAEPAPADLAALTFANVAPALGNAIRDAAGCRITQLPMTPACVLSALQARGDGVPDPRNTGETA